MQAGVRRALLRLQRPDRERAELSEDWQSCMMSSPTEAGTCGPSCERNAKEEREYGAYSAVWSERERERLRMTPRLLNREREWLWCLVLKTKSSGAATGGRGVRDEPGEGSWDLGLHVRLSVL